MIWVVKLGGSLMRQAVLITWLRALRQGGGRIVIVPGGGVYANRIRAVQRAQQHSDTTAHGLALNAMRRYGALLARQGAGLKQIATPGALRQVLRRKQVPLWSPVKMTPAWTDLPRNWSISADSLALRLATQLGAACLLLIKRPQPAQRTPADLVDAYFPGLWAAQEYHPPVYWLGAHDHALLRRALRSNAPPPGQRLVL